MSVSGLMTAAAVSLSGAVIVMPSATEVSRFQDPQIVESSGLVARGDTFVTTNDSGDAGRLFVVDQISGETRHVVEWAAEPEDVEALAPGPANSVWVADIGDNGAERETVTVSLVDLDENAALQSYDLRYPGGAADAEALLSDPVAGQLLVVTKSVFGGEVLAAPPQLKAGKVNRLESVGRVSGLVTDGAFFSDGRHVILRNYTEAFVFAYPTLDLVGSFDLPEQEQGEGLAIAGPDSIFLSSEGIEAPILRMRLPAELRRAMQPREQTPEPSASADEPGSEPTAAAASESGNRSWLWQLPTFAALAVGGWVVLTAVRRSSKRRR